MILIYAQSAGDSPARPEMILRYRLRLRRGRATMAITGKPIDAHFALGATLSALAICRTLV